MGYQNIKAVLNEEAEALSSGNKDAAKKVQRDLSVKSKEELKLQQSNTRDV